MYGAHEAKLYYVTEDPYGTTPPNPAMFGMNENLESVEPVIDPSNIKLRGFGSRDLTDIEPGLRKVNLKIVYFLPNDDILHFLQNINTLYPQTIEVIYTKDSAIVSLRHMGCIFDKATVSCSMEGAIKAEIDLIAQNLIPETAEISKPTPTDYGGLVPFTKSFIKIGDPDGSNLVATDEVTDWKCTINNYLKRIPVIRENPESLLTADATEGQKIVAVADGTKFATENMVTIKDATVSERNIIYSIVGNNLTMLNNLVNTYVVSADTKTIALVSNLLKYLRERHRDLTGELTFEFENRARFYDVIADKEFSVQLGLGDTKSFLFKYCKWDNIIAPTRIEDLISLRAPFTARNVILE